MSLYFCQFCYFRPYSRLVSMAMNNHCKVIEDFSLLSKQNDIESDLVCIHIQCIFSEYILYDLFYDNSNQTGSCNSGRENTASTDFLCFLSKQNFPLVKFMQNLCFKHFAVIRLCIVKYIVTKVFLSYSVRF